MLGIVILNYKTWELTVQCIQKMKEHLQLEHKIFIVDNSSPNQSYEMLKQVFQEDSTIECLLAKENGGYAKGNNIGIQACKQKGIKYALITNNDVEFFADTIFKMQRTIFRNPNAVIVSPKILSKTGIVNSIPFKNVPTLRQFLGLKSSVNLQVEIEKTTRATKVYSVPGSCMMIDVHKFTQMGAFDTGTFMYCEEGILAKQALAYGYDILFEPEASIIHNHGASTGLKNIFIESNVLCSSLYYWRKYENVSNIKLYMIYYFFIIKMIFKVLFRRIDSTGFFSAIKSCRSSLRKALLIERIK